MYYCNFLGLLFFLLYAPNFGVIPPYFVKKCNSDFEKCKHRQYLIVSRLNKAFVAFCVLSVIFGLAFIVMCVIGYLRYVRSQYFESKYRSDEATWSQEKEEDDIKTGIALFVPEIQPEELKQLEEKLVLESKKEEKKAKKKPVSTSHIKASKQSPSLTLTQSESKRKTGAPSPCHTITHGKSATQSYYDIDEGVPADKTQEGEVEDKKEKKSGFFANFFGKNKRKTPTILVNSPATETVQTPQQKTKKLIEK